MSKTATAGPFAGLRVVDASRRLSGAMAARLFGDFGADVILAEPPEGHPLRREPPFLAGQPGPESSAVHAYLNWNKRSVVVRNAAEAESLFADADVIIAEGGVTRPHAARVVLSITPYGPGSPRAGQPGNELTAAALSGWCSINGARGDAPVRMPGFQAGYLAGAAGFAAAPVIALGQLWNRPGPAHLDSGFVTSVDHPQAGPNWLPGAPWTIDGRRPAVTPAPCVGQHSAEILAAELGISEDDYRALVAAGITGTL